MIDPYIIILIEMKIEYWRLKRNQGTLIVNEFISSHYD